MLANLRYPIFFLLRNKNNFCLFFVQENTVKHVSWIA